MHWDTLIDMPPCKLALHAPTALQFRVQAGLAAESDTSPKALAPEGLTACKALFAQLPWEDIAQLEVPVIREDVQLPLIHFLTTVAMQAEGNADASELMHSAMTVSEAYCNGLWRHRNLSGSTCIWNLHPQISTAVCFSLTKAFSFCGINPVHVVFQGFWSINADNIMTLMIMSTECILLSRHCF